MVERLLRRRKAALPDRFFDDLFVFRFQFDHDSIMTQALNAPPNAPGAGSALRRAGPWWVLAG